MDPAELKKQRYEEDSDENYYASQETEYSEAESELSVKNIAYWKWYRKNLFYQMHMVVHWWHENEKFWKTRRDGGSDSRLRYIRKMVHGLEYPMGYVSREMMDRDGILPFNGFSYVPKDDHKAKERKQKKEGKDYYSDDSDDEGFTRAAERSYYQKKHRPFNHVEFLEDERVMRQMMRGGEPYPDRPDLLVNWKLRPPGSSRREGMNIETPNREYLYRDIPEAKFEHLSYEKSLYTCLLYTSPSPRDS